MRKTVHNRKRVEILFTPDEITQLDACASIAKASRVELVRRLVRWAYGDAVRCNLVKKESAHEPGAGTA